MKNFERRWALTLLQKVHRQLEDENVAHGHGSQFELLDVCLSGEPAGLSYADSAAKLGISEGAVRVAVHRLRKRFGQLLKEEVTRTVADRRDVDEEIRSLIMALG